MLNAAVILLPVAVMSTGPAICAQRSDLVVHLAQEFQERPVARGLSENGTLLEVFASRHGESWTAVATFANGLSCLIGAGQFWEETPHFGLDPERPS